MKYSTSQKLFITFLFLSVVCGGISLLMSTQTDDQIRKQILAQFTDANFNEAFLDREEFSETVSYTNLPTEIDVRTINGNIELVESDNDTLFVNITGLSTKNNEEKPYELSYENSRLKIGWPKGKKKKLFSLFNLGDDVSELNFKIFVPKRNIEKITLETIHGNVTFNQVLAQKFEVKTTSGDIHGNVPHSGEMEANTISGDIDLSTARVDHLNAKTVSGNIQLQLGKDQGHEFNLKSVSGEIMNRLSSEKGNQIPSVVSASTVSGDIDILPLFKGP